jgi:hypothetical protein
MSDLITEFANTSFSKPEGKSTTVTILGEKEIGKGEFGVAYDAEVQIGSRKRHFVIKRYNTPSSAQKEAARAVENWRRAKTAKLKVFPTYRLGEDGESILMTSANLDSQLCIGNMSLAGSGQEKLKVSHAQGTNLIEQVFSQAMLASEQNIRFANDSLFFLVNKETNDLDFVIADMDNVSKFDDLTINPIKYNLSQATIVLMWFFGNNAQNSDVLLAEAENKEQVLLHSFGLGN